MCLAMPRTRSLYIYTLHPPPHPSTPVSLQVGIPVAAGALLPVTGTMLTPSLAGALMGVSSLGVMANSLSLHLTFKPHSLQQQKKKSRQSRNEERGDIESGRQCAVAQ